MPEQAMVQVRDALRFGPRWQRACILALQLTRLPALCSCAPYSHSSAPLRLYAPQVLDDYLRRWGLEEGALMAQREPWFREGGHQQWLKAPEGLLWHREALMPERADETS